MSSKLQAFIIALSLQFTIVSSRILCNDDNGICPRCAGYSWCEALQKCVRPWVTPCKNRTVIQYL